MKSSVVILVKQKHQLKVFSNAKKAHKEYEKIALRNPVSYQTFREKVLDVHGCTFLNTDLEACSMFKCEIL